jgi:glycosyltransferase involved in cell wall biosynthesis
MRVWFAGRPGVQSLEDRARGLAAHLGPGFEAGFGFTSRYLRDTLAAARGHDVLWLLSQHPARLLAAAAGRRRHGTPFTVDTGDLLAESARTLGAGRLRAGMIAAWERRSVTLPDVLVVRGSAHLPVARGMGASRVELVRDGVEPARFARRDSAATRQRLGLTGKVVVGVVATIGFEPRLGLPSPGWDLIEVLARLPGLPLAGLVVGDGPGLERLRHMAAARGVPDKLRLTGRVPLAELPALLSSMDVFLHTALPNPMSEVRTTGKLPLLLASGCAAVVSAVGEAREVLAGSGMLLEFGAGPEDYAERLAARVRELVERRRLEEWREQGPAMARREFDYAALGARAAAIIRSLARRPG